MPLQPLVNLIAFAGPDPAELDAIGSRVGATGRYSLRARSEAEPLVAVSPLLGSGGAGGLNGPATVVVAEGRSVLENAGHDPGTLAGVVREDPERLAQIPGDFGLVALGPSGSADVVRSAGGLVPFYVWTGPEGRWCVTTTLAAMVLCRPELEPDPFVSAILAWGLDAWPERRSLLAGVRKLGRGEYARIEAGRLRFARWWHPERIEVRRSADHAARLRAAMVDSMEAGLDRDRPNLVALSGGVDSSAVAGLAGALGYPLEALTILYPEPEWRERDQRYIDSITAHAGIEVVDAPILDPDLRLELIDSTRLCHHVPQPYLCRLTSLAGRREVHSLLGGELADHTIGSALAVPDWARHAGLGAALRAASHGGDELAIGPREWLRHRARKLIGRPVLPWSRNLGPQAHPRWRSDYRDWFCERRRRMVSDPGPKPYLSAFLERDGIMGMHWEVCSALGIRRVFPFINRAVLELAYECHPDELVGRGTKQLLREALGDDVPHLNLYRPDKGGPLRRVEPPARHWQGSIPEAIRPVLAPGWPPPEPISFWEVCGLAQLVCFARGLEEARRGVVALPTARSW